MGWPTSSLVPMRLMYLRIMLQKYAAAARDAHDVLLGTDFIDAPANSEGGVKQWRSGTEAGKH